MDTTPTETGPAASLFVFATMLLMLVVLVVGIVEIGTALLHLS